MRRGSKQWREKLNALKWKWEQPRKTETVASRKWTKLNKRDRQSVKTKKYCLNFEEKNSIAIKVSWEGIRLAKQVPLEDSMFTIKILGTAVIRWGTVYHFLLVFSNIFKAWDFQVTIWATRKDSYYCIKLALLNTSDAFQSLFAQHTGADSLPY